MACRLCLASAESKASTPAAAAGSHPGPDHLANPEGRQGCTTREDCWEAMCRTVHPPGYVVAPAKTQVKRATSSKKHIPPPNQPPVSFSLHHHA